MVDSWKSIKVGGLLLVAVVLSYAIYRFVDERAGDDGYVVWTVFDDAQGLVEKSRVLIAGIRVGRIETIRLWGSRARVDIWIDQRVKLYKNATVSKRTASILGEYMLVIDPGSPPADELEDGDKITNAAESTSTDEILTDVGAVAASVRKIAEQMEQVFGTDEGGKKMQQALQSLTEALDGVNRTVQANEEVVSRTLRNVEDITATAKPDLERLLKNVADVSEEVRTILIAKEGRGASGVEKVEDTLSSLNRTAKELEAAVNDVREVTGRTARGEGTVGRLTSDERLIDEVEGVAEDIGDFVGGVTRLQTIVNLRSEYNMLANTFKSYFELRLQPREDKYYMIQLINDPRGSTSITQTTVRTSPPPAGVPSFYQENRVVTEDALRFSLMFAKRVSFTTFRFGLLESTGGVGVDMHLLDDRMEVNTDLFAFGVETSPRLRTRLAFEFVRRLWVLGGVDDALNDTSDFFLGGQLRFNDEDLKTILPFASVP